MCGYGQGADEGKFTGLKPLIDNYMDFIVNKEYRLADGTFARTRPQHNTLWLDDMFMGIPPVAWYSCIAGDKKQMYLSEAVRQIFQFADRMWVPGKNLSVMDGWKVCRIILLSIGDVPMVGRC